MNLACTIVIVSYNCREALQACLLKLTAEGDTPPILVVDNASTDGTIEMVARDFPTVGLIQNTKNLGFAAACNQGIRACISDFILLLNPDTMLKLATLQKLTDTMRAQPNIGACGPRILNTDGSLQPSCRRFPTLGAMVCDELGLGRLFPHSRRLAKYRMHGWEHNETATSINSWAPACSSAARHWNTLAFSTSGFFFISKKWICACDCIKPAGASCSSRIRTSRISAAKAARTILAMPWAIAIAACLPSTANTIPHGNCRSCGLSSKSPRSPAWLLVRHDYWPVAEVRLETVKVLFLTQTSALGPSSRYRVYQLLPWLQKLGITCEVSPAIDDALYRSLYLDSRSAASRR